MIVAKKAKATAIIPVRNGATTIEDTLRCLFEQTGNVLEKIIVVNDASNDNTAEIVSRFMDSNQAEIGPLLQMVNNSKRQWHYKSRNIGAKFVDTEYMFFLDADDTVEKAYVLKMVAALEANPQAPFSYCDVNHVRKTTNGNCSGSGCLEVIQQFQNPDFDLNRFLRHNFIAYSSMIRTADFRRIGGNSEFLNDCWNHAVERHLWLRLVYEFGKPVHVPEPLFNYHIHHLQQSKKHKRGRIDQQTQMFYNLDFIHLKSNSIAKDQETILFVCRARNPRNDSLPSLEMYTWIKPLHDFGAVFCFMHDVEEAYFGKAAMNQRLKDYADLIRPDYIFHVLGRNDIEIRTWEALSQKFTTIAWVLEDRWQPELLASIVKSFSLAITASPSVQAMLAKLQTDIFPSQWAANPHYLKRIDGHDRQFEAVFFGQKSNYRTQLMGGLPIEPYGNQWENGILEYPQMCRMLSGSKIAVNLAYEPNDNPKINLRIFEATASGALCLSEYAPMLERYFKFEGNPDSPIHLTDEIVVFEGRSNLEKKLKYLLDHPRLLYQVANNGYERTRRDHLWKNRLNEIFSYLQTTRRRMVS